MKRTPKKLSTPHIRKTEKATRKRNSKRKHQRVDTLTQEQHDALDELKHRNEAMKGPHHRNNDPIAS